METNTVDKRIPEPVDFEHLKQSTEVVVNENVSMLIEDGEVTFVDYKTNQTVTMTEWEMTEADLQYIYLRLEERNPVIKANRLAREKHEAEQEQNNE